MIMGSKSDTERMGYKGMLWWGKFYILF